MSQLKKFHVYFYLKLDDPGPKGQVGWDFSYTNQTKTNVVNKINQWLTQDLYTLNILETDELSKDELLSKVKNFNRYINFFKTKAKNEKIDKKYGRPVQYLHRAMNCHYNLYQCGFFIKDFQKFTPKYIIYTRPDLMYKKYINLNMINDEQIILNKGPNPVNIDHFAVLPFRFYYDFFFKRFLTYCENESVDFSMPEDVYLYTIKNNFKVLELIQYYIKRT